MCVCCDQLRTLVVIILIDVHVIAGRGEGKENAQQHKPERHRQPVGLLCLSIIHLRQTELLCIFVAYEM